MGVWGYGPFENDEIMDLVDSLASPKGDIGQVTKQLRNYLKGRGSEVEVYGLGELVYAVVSKDGSRLPEQVIDLPRRVNLEPQVVDLAIQAVEKAIHETDPSGWKGNSGLAFQRGLENLLRRLRGLPRETSIRKMNPVAGIVRPWFPRG